MDGVRDRMDGDPPAGLQGSYLIRHTAATITHDNAPRNCSITC
jgi:hypothetical protein